MIVDAHTATHEAGHCVAHIRLGIEHAGANLVATDGRLGASIAHGVDSVWDKPAAESQVLAFCSGYAAMVAAGVDHAVALGGTGDDFEQAQYLIDFWGLNGTLDAWRARAVELMRQPQNVAAIALLANHLLEHKRLDGDYVEAVVELSDGEITDGDFERYLLLRGWPDKAAKCSE